MRKRAQARIKSLNGRNDEHHPVRTEIVGNNIESITTYDPYGNLLVQTGNSGTTYGYTGEQQDSATGLLYLRARYYNPALRTFMGRDAWTGNMQKPQSMNGWSYVENNPVNLTDPTGLFPDRCKNSSDISDYVWCVTAEYGIFTNMFKVYLYEESGYTWDREFNDAMRKIKKDAGCYSGPVPYKAPGYLQGIGVNSSLIYDGSYWESRYSRVAGRETVFDFATFRAAPFVYNGYYLEDSIGAGYTKYVGNIYGLRSWKTIEEYGGTAVSHSYGLGINGLADTPFEAGLGFFHALPNVTISGATAYIAVSFGADAIPIFEPSVAIINASMVDAPDGFRDKYTVNEDKEVQVSDLQRAILEDEQAPWRAHSLLRWVPLVANPVSGSIKFDAKVNVEIYAKVYEDMKAEELGQ